MRDKQAILVMGANDATGGAIAKRVAKEAYIACVTRHSVDKLQTLAHGSLYQQSRDAWAHEMELRPRMARTLSNLYARL